MKVFDAHSDILIDVSRRYEGGLRRKQGKKLEEWIQIMKRNGVYGRILSIWVEGLYKPGNTLKRALDLISIFYRELSNTKGVTFVKRAKDLKDEDVLLILSLEGADPLYDDILLLDAFLELGVRVITLTWSDRNFVADGIFEERTKGGLTNFGVELLEEMEKRKIIPDVSHISEQGFWDVLEVYKGPVMASHSNSRTIWDHPRNLKDEQIEAIAERKGFIGLNAIPKFLGEAPTLGDYIKHLTHVAEIAGIDYVGFGFDFVYYIYDDYKGASGLSTEEDIPNLLSELSKEFSEKELSKICWGNLFNFLRRSLP